MRPQLQKNALSGEAEFPLNAFFERPKSNGDGDELRKYMTQLRQEVGSRLVDRVSIL
jgi:actin related protein 2/3 complex, subunit 3